MKALCQQAGARDGVDQPTPFDLTEKIFEAGDDCVQVGKDYILYGCEGKDEVCERDKFFFKKKGEKFSRILGFRSLPILK